MKNLFSNIILVLFAGQAMFAQARVDNLINDSTKLYVEYADYDGFINDSIYTSLRKGSLFIGKKAAVYIYQTKSPEEFVKSMREKFVVTKGKVDLDEMINSFKKHYDIEKKVSVIYLRYNSSPDFLLLKSRDDGDIWLSDTLDYNWKPVNEFKTINRYKCQKAIAFNLRGEDVIAWFTEEIPISLGPLNLSGLPGLILEYYNPKVKRFFKAITISSTTIPKESFRKWLSGPILSKDAYADIYRNESKKIEQFKRMMEMKTSTKQ